MTSMQSIWLTISSNRKPLAKYLSDGIFTRKRLARFRDSAIKGSFHYRLS